VQGRNRITVERGAMHQGQGARSKIRQPTVRRQRS
jgi:hypothetical protein